MKTSKKGIALLKQFEGCKLQAYKDGGGVWTVGFGATGPNIGPHTNWSQAQAEDDLAKKLEDFEWAVSGLLQVPINQNQFDALVCFSYNVGVAALARSSLLKQLNMKHFKDAGDRFLDWSHDGGKVIPGLLKRREAERQLFLL